MIPFDKCPICAGGMEEKEVEKIVRGGQHTALFHVRAEVCLHCGERLYDQETISYFAQIRTKLERHETAAFQPLGQFFAVPDRQHDKLNTIAS